jgi:hypothetical protein
MDSRCSLALILRLTMLVVFWCSFVVEDIGMSLSDPVGLGVRQSEGEDSPDDGVAARDVGMNWLLKLMALLVPTSELRLSPGTGGKGVVR